MRRVPACLVTAVVLLSVVLLPPGSSGSGTILAVSLGHGGGVGVRDFFPPATPLTGATSHDLVVSASNVTTLVGMPVNFTATIAGVAPVQTTWWWGDGTTSIATTNPVTHTYHNPGIYLVYTQGTNSTGAVHDNLGALLRFAVQESYANDVFGNEAQVQGNVVANASTTTAAEAALAPGQWVQVSNWVTNLPTDPQWTLEVPRYTLAPSAVPYVNLSTILGTGLNLSAATLSWSGSTPQGSYTLNFSVSDVNPFVPGSGTTWDNYTFTMFVSPSAATPATPVPASPHNGTLEVYQEQWIANDLTLDPGLAEDSVDGPILQNLYQTLIVYNGSEAGPAPSDFVPDLATCVPGSAQCASMYGSSLVSADNWTFVINPNATFYNGTTGATAGIYPNDVAFSFARACALANSNGPQGEENFVLCQALLPNNANSSWDSGIHAPWNNTPANILDAMTVNSTQYCTSAMKNGVLGNGCITFDTAASGKAWPEFLELVESSTNWAVASCSFEASQGMGLPQWTNGSVCYPAPPGSSGNPNAVPSATQWDGYELAQGSWYSNPQPVPDSALRFHAYGSGPYYLVSFDDQTGYTLKANPDWGGTTCQGGRLEGCLPGPTKGGRSPTYIPNVVANFETGDGPGLAAMASGNADLVDTGGNASVFLAEAEAGKLDYLVGPSLTMSWWSIVLDFNTTAATSWMGSPVTLPANATQDLNFRQFMIQSYPYATAESKDCLADGILYCFNYGGGIPVGMTGYYPTNITWPLSDPDTNPNDVGSAAWWWHQVATDPMVGASCTASSPCTFPIPQYGLVNYSVAENWVQSMASISGGAIQAKVVNVTFFENVVSLLSQSGNASFPTGGWGWAPDYFDPNDYVWDTFSSMVQTGTGRPQYLLQPEYLHACAGPAVDPTVTTSCQGTAYSELLSLLSSAGSCVPPLCSQAQRELLYNMADRIAYGLGLNIAAGQAAAVYAFAPWIASSSLLLNPDRNNVWGGVTSDQPFFFIQYATSIPQGYQLQVQLSSPGATPSTPSGPSVATPAVHAIGSVGLTLEAGEPFLTLVSVSGGTGVYHYIWNDLPTGCASASAAVLSCRPTGAGNFSMSVTVVDSKGDTGTSNAIALAVAAHVAITGFHVTPSDVVLGKSVKFMLSASGGIGSITYAYAGLPPGCTSGNVTTFTCTPSAVGHYSITAGATDSIGLQAFAAVELNVSTAATITSPTFLGLPGSEGYYLILGLAAAAVVLGVAWEWRRRRNRARKSEEPAAAAQAAPTVPAETSGTLSCPQCGASNSPGAKYCNQCASPLST